MKSSIAIKDIQFEDYALTLHAKQRMGMRGFSISDVNLVLLYGRRIHVRGAVIHAVGRKELVQCAEFGIDLSSMDGLQVVCSNTGSIMTVYRNRDFRGLRPKRRRTH